MGAIDDFRAGVSVGERFFSPRHNPMKKMDEPQIFLE